MIRLNLGTTIADLKKARRNWQKYLPTLKTSPTPSSPARSSSRASRLKELTDFGDNPGGLRMLCHVPKNMRAHGALVVVLHGCTQTASGYDHNSGWSALADKHGFALLFAEQRPENNANTCFNWFVPGDIARDQGETRSILQMVDRMKSDHRIDPRRIFITGLSAGGAMANVMLATHPEVFAAGAIIAGLPYGCATSVMEALSAMKLAPRKTATDWGNAVRGASSHRGPWPTVTVWHGAGDRVVSLSNGRAVASQWADVHGLKETVFKEKMIAADIVQRSWGLGDGFPPVELITIKGMDHGTPIDPTGKGGEKSGIAGPLMLDAGISSTLVMAQKWGLV